MRKSFQSLLLAVSTLLLASHAVAEPVSYSFTATRGYGDPAFGNLMSGTIVLDVGSTNGTIYENPGYGQYGFWYNGAFAIDAMTDAGYVSGTALGGGTTEFAAFDYALIGSTQNRILWYTYTATGVKSLTFSSFDYARAEDGIASIPDPWNPFSLTYNIVDIYEVDFSTGLTRSATYFLDTFAPTIQRIVIDGFDTGLDDFTFEGQKVSEILAGYAESASNHGGFVSETNKLAAKLRKAGLLTEEQSNALGNAAAQSGIGKP